jgi:regulatory protein YycI of two-component signal transduction system YycFG
MDSHYQWQILIRRILKWLFCVVVCFLIFVFVVLVFFSWKASQREIKITQEVAPRTGNFVKVNNIEIFIQEEGQDSGQPVLLIHGTGAWSEIWR